MRNQSVDTVAVDNSWKIVMLEVFGPGYLRHDFYPTGSDRRRLGGAVKTTPTDRESSPPPPQKTGFITRPVFFV